MSSPFGTHLWTARAGWTPAARRSSVTGMSDGDATLPGSLDLRGLKCPLPVLHTRRALVRARPGETLEVRCTDPLAGLDIPNLVRETGDVLVATLRQATEIRFTIRKA